MLMAFLTWVGVGWGSQTEKARMHQPDLSWLQTPPYRKPQELIFLLPQGGGSGLAWWTPFPQLVRRFGTRCLGELSGENREGL